MKTIQEIKSQTPIFLNDWTSITDVAKDFKKEEIKATNILFASYSAANYSGDAWVLFEKDGELYEINGSHCSCFGLEDQWDAEKVVLTELENRLTKGEFGIDNYSDNNFKQELITFLGIQTA